MASATPQAAQEPPWDCFTWSRDAHIPFNGLSQCFHMILGLSEPGEGLADRHSTPGRACDALLAPPLR